MTKKIPYGRQHITQDDVEAVVKTLTSDFLTQGPRIAEFEAAFANYIGCKYAVAVSNGTAALHLSCMALDVGSQSRVITTPITFAASANCVRYCGGQVTFADIDPATYLLDIKNVRSILESSPQGHYDGIIPVDFTGRPIDLEEFRQLADDHGLWMIEDACHAPGGTFRDSSEQDQNCGNGYYADLAIFSFHPVKHIACGEGGMITTNDEELYKKLLALRTHGIIKDEEQYQNSTDFAAGTSSNEFPGWYMELQELGYNYRLTDIQAALGTSQLEKAEERIIRRREIASTYYKEFKDLPFIKGQSGVIEGHAYHLYIVQVKNRLGLYKHLREMGIYVQIHYIPCHLMPYYRNLGSKEGDLVHAEEYYRNCISLPMYPTLTNEEQLFVIKQVKEFYHS